MGVVVPVVEVVWGDKQRMDCLHNQDNMCKLDDGLQQNTEHCDHKLQDRDPRIYDWNMLSLLDSLD